jgi:hypothetical protein
MVNDPRINQLIVDTLKFFRGRYPDDDNQTLHDKTYKSVKKAEFLTHEEMEGISDSIWERLDDED